MTLLSRAWARLTGRGATGRDPDPAATIPSYARPYKQTIREEWDCLKQAGIVTDEGLKTRFDLILSDTTESTWVDLFLIERTILSLQPDAEVKARARDLRDRYRVVIGEPAYAEYLKTPPPDEAKAPTADLRTDLDQILREFHWRYLITPVREAERGRVTLTMIVPLLIVAVLFSIVSLRSDRPGLTLFVMSLFVGALGACVSLQHRMQSVPSTGDAILNILSLRSGFVSVLLAPINGAIFAFILHLGFAAGLLQGTLFPAYPSAGASPPPATTPPRADEKASPVTAPTTPAKPPADKPEPKAAEATRPQEAPVRPADSSFFGFIERSMPTGTADLAKLLLWCFIAGFAERLIPDTLDRMIIKKVAVMEAESPSKITTPAPDPGKPVAGAETTPKREATG